MLLLTFFQINVFKKYIQENFENVKVLGSRSGLSVGPDLGPNCLQRLSADNKNCCKERVMKSPIYAVKM